MPKRKILALASASYTNNVLDSEKVNRVAKLLSRNDLKQYIKALKTEEMKRSVIATVPFGKEDVIKKQLEELYPNKRVIVQTDPQLILGVKIQENDIVYNMTLENVLHEMLTHVQKAYDY